ncbi:LysR family transcriptional regulator [Pectobacterium atrosepticum]|uniref:LysR family transcriptional regulator n=1 Tax=Pectobacterium atrosepticum TaxID=29471 RepID=UPI00049A6344|nr:LysR family transcriptional regulator [Pectobacterium atrosepticum]AIA71190.1 LysR family transcriptional regulator [Pectobacterium atrosepticum]AIK13986.1 LysR-family transcriptional regulator [Pectobacterium atrosepticum]POW32196.1 LysR family transcriptional regulator [Pectobacterium atrosepticum]
MDKLQAMTTFVAVVKAGSFVKAMESTGFSKPAVSRQVIELEKFLGVRLLHRTTRRISLTSEGETYYQRCKEVLSVIEEAENQVCARANQAHGRLRIGVPQDFGVLQLTPLWAQFMDRNPKVEFDIVLSDRNVDPVEEGYDLVVRIGNLPDSTLVSSLLATTRLILCASPEYLRLRGTPTHPTDLDKHVVIAYSYNASGNEWLFCKEKREQVKVSTHPRLNVNSGATCRLLAIESQGIILQPDFLVHSDIIKGKLVEIIPEWQAQTLEIHALYPTRILLPLKVQLLRDFLSDSLRPKPWLSPAYDPWEKLLTGN